MLRAVVATAGHVDHGKSTLVRALTGTDPDRLAEEQRRGLTIDLGFAWFTLPSGTQLAFVDVPGHERFIATMLAGLGPAPAVLFVVAADGGWERQSAEHLAAIDALGVRHGVLAVTRSDLADPRPARAEALRHLAGSSLGAVDAVAVSGRTGDGLPELRAALDALVAAVPPMDARAPVRLWVDRSFSIRGAGTVVTGTLAGGSIRVDDRFELDGVTVTVRGLESAGARHDELTGPARVALNLRGIAAADIARGAVLLTPGAWHRTTVLDVRVDTAGLPAEALLHAGSASVTARVRPLDDRHARLTLSRALPLRTGDRAALRNPGRHAVAGVEVLDADPPALRRRGAARARAARLADGVPDAATEVAVRGAVRREHLDRLGFDTGALPDDAGWLVDPLRRSRWVAAVPKVVAGWRAQHPLDPAVPHAALARLLDVPPPLLPGVVAAAGLVTRDGRVGDAVPTVPAGVEVVLSRLRAEPFRALEAAELAELGVGHRELAVAERAGVILLVGGVVLLPDAPARAMDRLRAIAQPFTLSAARSALSTTRRVAVPLLEHLDHLGATVRVDAQRRRVRHDEAVSS